MQTRRPRNRPFRDSVSDLLLTSVAGRQVLDKLGGADADAKRLSDAARAVEMMPHVLLRALTDFDRAERFLKKSELRAFRHRIKAFATEMAIQHGAKESNDDE